MSYDRAFEDRLNGILAQLLEKVGLEERAEYKKYKVLGPSKHRRRIDIFVIYRCVDIVIECAFSGNDAVKDAKKRIEEGLAHLAIALVYPPIRQDLTESEIQNVLLKSRFRIKLFTSLAPIEHADITSKIPRPKEVPLVQDWLEVDIPQFRQVIDYAVQYIIPESEIALLQQEIDKIVQTFAERLSSLDPRYEVARRLYEIYYKLYGLSVGDYRQIRDLIYRKAALTLLLSATFYECICSQHGRPKIEEVAKRERLYYESLRHAFEEILEINYQPIFDIARDVLNALPPEMEFSLREIVTIARKIASTKALLRRDFTGRIYHRIVGEFSVRKGFATYFTSCPAAYLLAYLALLTPNPAWSDVKWSSVENFIKRGFRIADFACGSGTLLSASYDALQYLHLRDALHEDEEPDLATFHAKVLENVIWGLDALRYTAHIASTVLALRNPEAPASRFNIYACPLGEYNSRIALGSLDLLSVAPTGGKVITITAFCGVEERVAEAISPAKTYELSTLDIPREYDVVIMNPPFTRATGRSERVPEEQRGLFGFIPSPDIRDKVKERYESVRDLVRNRLKDIAEKCGYLRKLRQLLVTPQSVNPFLNVGHAGEGLLFLYLAHERLRNGGRLAFVLPRNLLSGISWYPARTLLATHYHIEYVLVSLDAEKGYNWSESTALSEVLLVARKVGEKCSPDERTCFVVFIRKSSTILEAIQVANEIIDRYVRYAEDLDIAHGLTAKNYIKVNSCEATLFTVPKKLLDEYIDNWGRFVAFADPWLSVYTLQIFAGKIVIDKISIDIPVKRLGELCSIGIDRHQFHDAFQVALSSLPSALPAVLGGGEERRLRMRVEPNAYVLPKDSKAKRYYSEYASNLLVPEIRIDTAHVLALYCTKPVLSNIFYAVKFRTNVEDIYYKALCLWFNTTWGILTVLANRAETEGAWSELKLSHWRVQPVINVTALPREKVAKLAELFDRYCTVELPRLPEQYDKLVQERLRLDIAFLKVLDNAVDEDKAREFLKKLYSSIAFSLKVLTKRN